MSKLSPQAQAVLDAALRALMDHRAGTVIETTVAAALRAAADQLVPYVHSPGGCREGERQCVRREFLAIAAELEAHP